MGVTARKPQQPVAGPRVEPDSHDAGTGARARRGIPPAIGALIVAIILLGGALVLARTGPASAVISAAGVPIAALAAHWPTGYLLFLSAVAFVEGYILAGRPTLSLSRYLMTFTFGSVGAVALSIILERISTRLASPVAVAYTIAPLVEETAKLIPVLLIAGLFSGWRKLSIGDMALLGLASGLGFEFVEENLRVLTHGTLAVGGTAMVSPFISGWRKLGDGLVNAAGHGIWTTTVALAVAWALALTRRRAVALVVGLIALAWVTFDHSVFNWEVAATSGGGTLPGRAAFLYGMTLHGRLEIVLLPVGLLWAALVDDLRLNRVVGVEHRLRWEGRWTGFVTEWITALGYAFVGPGAITGAFRYFRLRRAYALALDAPRREEATANAEYLDRLLRVQSDQVARARTWRQALRRVPLAVGWFLRGLRPQVVPALILAFVFLLFAIPPGALPAWLSRPILSSPLVLGFGLLGLGYAILRGRDFRLQPRPFSANATGEVIVGWDMRILLLLGAALLPIVSIAGWLFPHFVWAPIAGTFVTDAVGEWTLCGGIPPPSGPGAGAKKDWLAIQLTDQSGRAIPNQPYSLSPVPGSGLEARNGVLDSSGYAVERDLDPEQWYVTFPDIDGSSWGSAGAPPKPEATGGGLR